MRSLRGGADGAHGPGQRQGHFARRACRGLRGCRRSPRASSAASKRRQRWPTQPACWSRAARDAWRRERSRPQLRSFVACARYAERRRPSELGVATGRRPGRVSGARRRHRAGSARGNGRGARSGARAAGHRRLGGHSSRQTLGRRRGRRRQRWLHLVRQSQRQRAHPARARPRAGDRPRGPTGEHQAWSKAWPACANADLRSSTRRSKACAHWYRMPSCASKPGICQASVR